MPAMTFAACVLWAAATFAHAGEAGTWPSTVADQSQPGKGNAAAAELGARSPLVQTALRFMINQTKRLRSPKLRAETLDILQNPRSCIAHRVGLNEGAKTQIIEKLIKEGLLLPETSKSFPGGVVAGVFPPVLDDGSACPYAPQSFAAAPGGGGAGHAEHHSYPGGLVLHEVFVQLAAMSLGQGYQRTYLSENKEGFPVMALPSMKPSKQARQYMNDDVLCAAPIWHDWSKIFVTQWHEDGSIFRELEFGGNGKTDAWGSKGDSRDRSHHILGVAEAMSRGLDPDVVITIASAHAVPFAGNEFRTVNFLRTAAIIARVDPVERGYLYRDNEGRLRIPPVHSSSNKEHTASTPKGSHMMAEYALHQLADGDYSFSNPAAYDADDLLEKLAPEFGFDPKERATYNLRFRNPALAYLSSERLAIVYSNAGLQGVRIELQRLRKKKLI
jgi:hypothetical protein